MSEAQERPTGTTGAAGTAGQAAGTASQAAGTAGQAATPGPGTPGYQRGAHRSTGYQEGYGESDEYGGDGRTAAAMGGTALAAALMILAGLVTFFEGIVGVIKGSFYTSVANYPFYFSVRGRGWTLLIIGAVIFAAGVCVLLGMLWARVVGIVLAVLSAIANFLFLPYYPIWSLIVIALDVFIIWALATAGRRHPA